MYNIIHFNVISAVVGLTVSCTPPIYTYLELGQMKKTLKQQ